MEGNKSKPRALLVFGAPCSGKSTFAEKFGKKYKLADFDFDELASEYGFTREQMFVILEQLLKTQQSIIVQGGTSTEKDRIEMRNMLRDHGYEPTLIWIQTDVSTIRSRLKSKFRSVSKAKEFYDNVVSAMEAPSENEYAIILSGKHTFETQSKHVIAGLADLALGKQ
ncbi:ATP-binding protein [Candidatus Saccharibacteria bacterium]|nr:ATP-binding protein [Candidatus Saccharibacteria bacterium]